ncbi:MAG TPA: glycoside hydrolase family 2 TIM barrel-domain containing protein, partial [Verrucomicrobiae bacterium]|nr:glycoside hydrolase family 2 TIM barrel-domain containing protein [Verrucomicrobiae bacterium]
SAMAALPMLGCRSGMASSSGSHAAQGGRVIPLDQNWLFGGELVPAALGAGFDDSGFDRITLPHCATKLSWQNWDWEGWQKVWCYRRHFSLSDEPANARVFLDFEGVMVGTQPVINGHELPKHLGGYLPFSYEITDWVKPGKNVLALAVDSRWSDAPPQGSPKGPSRIDYLEPGGIHRPVRLRVVPKVFISDVFAKPVNVLDSARRLDVLCSIDAAAPLDKQIEIQVAVKDGAKVISHARKTVNIAQPGQVEVKIAVSDLKEVRLWDVDAPKLYNVVVTLVVDGRPWHDYQVRIGFREAQFRLDGFFLNGKRLQIFGLDRHELYPYVGYAMPARAKRLDAHILRHDYNCNFVRCSHYPQSPEFLDACDEMGLLVWQEVPGWSYLGDASWRELLVRDVKTMVVRDRNRPSVVIWGTRVNESPSDESLYSRTRAAAKALDDTRPTSGTLTPASRKHWKTEYHEDVFAYDDYHANPDGSVAIEPPLPGRPYLITEAVGQFNYTTNKAFDCYYRRAGNVADQQKQAVRHAQAHDRAALDPRICGVVAWCGFEYGSLVNGYHRLKCPGVADVFRLPKLGAAFYLAQADPKIRVVIEPDFYWDFGHATPRGPGKAAAIFSNCDRLQVFVGGKHHATLRPDAANYPNLKHPPFFVDLDLGGSGHPELRIDGFISGRLALSRSFSSDPSSDQLMFVADDAEITGDGVDAVRLVVRVGDKFGAQRLLGGGEVTFEVQGPGMILGDNPLSLVDCGGAGAVWLKTNVNARGIIHVTAAHSAFGSKSLEMKIKSA